MQQALLAVDVDCKNGWTPKEIGVKGERYEVFLSIKKVLREARLQQDPGLGFKAIDTARANILHWVR